MKTKINTIKADLYNVFVMGDASNNQITRVHLLLTIPFLALYYAIGHIPA